ncbi:MULTISPECIES: lysozyme [unclassified Paenibacillus]|uniref:lysozyme n=1 Tax=unclassified Paenibacillus TaxID=185978 RepID=UPI00247719B8|nr:MULTISPECIES: lysozyme [unclassified Paenibacillus]MDH6430296.1 GH24 family phage-related lysozyme (muramidase) [Paenibacillus sp. PastH-4]MDH6446511.1 GH24 family phage-related lysozyme (muramidase) [Paenibacillus sp. PastF-4]MDH6530023.1 GH24 family phage-related lysozyme (muramidase) [Paenibacillus sp. PastH-3]
MGRKISQVGISLIKSFEGCRLTAYKPVPTEVYYTIGWGHYGPDVKAGMTITQAQADSMLVSDLAKYESYVNDPVYVPVTAWLNQNQFDALTSFCYNCGNGSLKQLCKGRTIAEIAQNITKYNKGGGNVLAGLVRRRKAELDLYNKADVSIKIESPKTKEDDTLELTNYQWTMLSTQVKGLLTAGTITDKTWLTKTDKKMLTTSELAWLSFIVAKK